jgi:hypothetical protein
MVKNPGGRNIVSALRETLDSVVTPSVRETILARALAAAKRDELPTEPDEFEEFLQGPLHAALVKALGPELGLSVSSELEHISALASQHGRRTSRPPPRLQPETVRPGAREKSVPSAGRKKVPRSTMPSPELSSLPPGSAVAPDQKWAQRERRGIAPTIPAARGAQPSAEPGRPSRAAPRPSRPGTLPVSADYPRGVARALGVVGTASVDPRPSRRPTVLLASADPDLIRLFQAWLDLRAAVEPVTGATQLIERLAQVGGPRAVIVLDGKQPAVRALTLAAIADELPEGTTVILWGVQAHLHARMCTISAVAERWTVYASDATSNEIVAECARVVG